MMPLALLQEVTGGATDVISDILAPVGGAALIALCIRLAVSAYKDSATTAREREKVCTDALASSVTANTALTAEMRTNHADLKASIQEILGHIRRGEG